jgi:hypothetical protein
LGLRLPHDPNPHLHRHGRRDLCRWGRHQHNVSLCRPLAGSASGRLALPWRYSPAAIPCSAACARWS